MAASHGFDASAGGPVEAKARVYQSAPAKANGGPSSFSSPFHGEVDRRRSRRDGGGDTVSAGDRLALDPIDHADQIITNLNGRYAHHTNAALSQPGISPGVMRRLLFIGVNLAIDFDSQPRFCNVEV